MENPSALVTIGWRERVALPAWGIRGLRAKIDTGARTSAVHVEEIQELPDGRIRFEVVTREKPERHSVWVESEVEREARVKPSSGVAQRRPVVRTVLRIGGVEHEIELSLVARRGMLNRMLVGRTALEGFYLVDPSRTYLTRVPRTPKPENERS